MYRNSLKQIQSHPQGLFKLIPNTVQLIFFSLLNHEINKGQVNFELLKLRAILIMHQLYTCNTSPPNPGEQQGL
jgi:hypothetical protein